MRAMWRGEISFGLVMIPVRLYSATEQRDVTFRQVHRTDGGRIRFRRICSIDGEEVPYADVAKGYELPNGEMVVLTDEDMAELPLPTAHGIEVLQFSPTEQVDSIMWERSYYTEPEPNGVRAYALLRDALDRSGMVAVAKVALRQRESLAALRVRDGVIVLVTLLWPDEVRIPDFEFLEEDVEVRSQELKMAASLIDSMTVDFDPSQYTDHYREAVEELVEAKVEGHEVTTPTAPAEEKPATSLADALRASLAAVGDEDGDSGGAKSRPGRPVSATEPKRATRRSA
jgi:DNA end-binding protein Ku